jgi:DNA-binding MarR family transcriptional regulator
MCSSFRRAARSLTHVYEEALRPLGLRATQFTVLLVLAQAGEVSQGRLGEMLAMDSTSLTRTLAIMLRQGWIAERRGADRRERRLSLSDSGKAQLNHALPVWEEVQTRVRDRLGKQAWTALQDLTYQVASVTTNHITEEGETL